MSHTVRVVCTAPWVLNDERLAVVRAVSPEVEVRTAQVANGDDVARALGDAEVLHTQLPPSTIEHPPNLMWIQFWTPHVSNSAPDYERDALAFFAQNLRRCLAGEPLLNLVDPQRGY